MCPVGYSIDSISSLPTSSGKTFVGEMAAVQAARQNRKVFYLVDLGLFKEAVILGRQYLQRSAGRAEDYIALGSALRASGESGEAALLLEQALLLFPASPEVRKALAHVYIQREQLTAAADILPHLPGSALLKNSFTGQYTEPRFGQAAQAPGEIGVQPVLAPAPHQQR